LGIVELLVGAFRVSSVICPLLLLKMLDRVGDRVRSLQDLGTLQNGSVLSWQLVPTQVVLISEQAVDWNRECWIESIDFDIDFDDGHNGQIRLALSVEWRSGSAQELDALLPEVWCGPTAEALPQALTQLQKKWTSTYWSQLRQSYGLVAESIALMIQRVPTFKAAGQVVRWMRKSQVCHVLETDWPHGQDSNLTEEQKSQLCQAVLEMPNLWHQDYSMSWGLDHHNQFWILTVAVGETLLTLPKSQDIKDLSQSVIRGSSKNQASGIAQILPSSFPLGYKTPLTHRTIAVIKELLPHAVPFLRSVQAIIVETDAWNSHGVILARELGIPVLVGVERATEIIQPGEALVLRGFKDAQPLSSTQHVRKTGLLVNRSQLAFRDQWTEDLGLVRSEWLLLPEFSPDRQPFDGAQFKQIMRSRLTELLDAIGEKQDTSVLYYRCLNTIEDRETAASLELNIWHEVHHRAWVQGRSLPPIRLILPFVQTLEQFVRWHQDLVALNLVPTLQPWIMAEVPSVVPLLPDYLDAGAMGVLIGLNDLTQWTLGVSRQSELFQASMKKPDRALIRSVQQIIRTSQQAQRPCWLVLSHWNETWAKIAIETGVTGLMVERDIAMLAAAAIDRLELSLQTP
jgi:phosphohistidine swiveling domain-containing protein